MSVTRQADTIQNFYVANPSPILQSLLWQYSSTKALATLVTQKQNWYTEWDDGFWVSWIDDVFNLVTADNFGLSVWCILLQVPNFLNSGGTIDNSEIWGFNEYVPPGTPPTLLNTYQNFGGSDGTIGANFSASADSTILTTEQLRWLLRMKYLYLVSRGSIPQSNYNFNWLMKSSVFLGAFSATAPVSDPVILMGTTTLSSKIITGLSSTEDLVIGQGIIGTGIPPETVIVSIDSPSTITMSLAATASGTVSLQFGSPTLWVLENFNMSITYQFNFFLPSVLQRVLNSVNILPDPGGVEVIKEYWNGSTYVQF
jgi:hypothetical protein